MCDALSLFTGYYFVIIFCNTRGDEYHEGRTVNNGFLIVKLVANSHGDKKFFMATVTRYIS